MESQRFVSRLPAVESLLFVALDDVGGSHRRAVQILAELASRATLAQQSQHWSSSI
jgi:hypothetical protein